MNTLLLIDGNAIIHRAFHAIPDFKNKSGLHTNALHGFFAILYKATIDFKPTHLVICFDTPKATFRAKLLASYQAQRPSAPYELKMQFAMIREALDAAGLTRLEKDGFEADDVIGTIAARYKSKGFKILILTGDKDIMQLIDKNVFVITPQHKISEVTVYDKEEVVKKLGIPPSQIPDYKAIVGDPSDNYFGAKGIGPKTAVRLLTEYGTVENIYKNLDNIKEERIRRLLLENKANVVLSKRLATILLDVKVENNIDKTKFLGFNEKLKDTFDKFEIRTLKARIFNEQAREVKHEKKVEKMKKPEAPSDQIDLF